MITFEKYVNGVQYCWYESSNIIYSECHDIEGDLKTLVIVFKGGKKYLYRNVDVNDYLQFRMSESNGKAFHALIKKYPAVRLSDISLEDLEQKRLEIIKSDEELSEEKLGNLSWKIKYHDNSGKFELYLDDKPIYTGTEGQVSIVNLFRSMSLAFGLEAMSDEDLAELNKEKNFE